MVFMGAGYSACAAALWPCVALIMPSHQIGTAYGAMTAFQNLGLAVAPLIVGVVLKQSNTNYNLAEYIFAGCASCAVAFTVLLIIVDTSRGRRLNCSPKRLKRMNEELEKQQQQTDETKPLLLNT